MNEPSAERPFYETANRVRAADQPPASRTPVIILSVFALILSFVMEASARIPADLLPMEASGYFTAKVMGIFVGALILAGLGALLLIGTAARRHRQRTWGEDFGWLLCAALTGSGLGFCLFMALTAPGGTAG
jgi:drug/metabolite transporter (DMT)-like permease